MAKVHLEHPTQAAACGTAAAFVGEVLSREEFRATPERDRCKRCERVLAAMQAGRPHYSGFEPELFERTPEDVARWIRENSEDADLAVAFARASTEEIALGLGISTEDAYRLAQAAARRGLIKRHPDRKRLRGSGFALKGGDEAKAIGWALWEVYWDPELEPNASRHDAAMRRELRKAASRTPTWKPGSPKAYIVDLATEAGVSVEEAAPVLVEMNREGEPFLSRIDMPEIADRAKARRSTIETGVFGGWQLVNLEILGGRRKNPGHMSKAEARRRAEELGHRMTVWSGGPLANNSVCTQCGAKLKYVEGGFSEPSHAVGRALTQRCDYRFSKPTPSDLSPNGGYYIWVIGKDGEPLLEGPYGPHELERAKTFARIAATKGANDRAVSLGLSPTAPSFEIVRRYEAGSGKRIL